MLWLFTITEFSYVPFIFDLLHEEELYFTWLICGWGAGPRSQIKLILHWAVSCQGRSAQAVLLFCKWETHTCCKLSLDLAPSSKKSLESRRVEPTVVSLKGFIDIFSATMVGCVPWSTSSCWTKFGPPNLDDELEEEHWSTDVFSSVCYHFSETTMFIFDSLLGKESKTLKNLMEKHPKVTAIFIRV